MFPNIFAIYDHEIPNLIPVRTTQNVPCVFPFFYNGQMYTECTLDGNRGGGAWCATVEQLDVNSAQWGFCFLLCELVISWLSFMLL